MEPVYQYSKSIEAAQTPAPSWDYAPRRGLSIPTITVLDSAGRVIEQEQRNLFRHVAQQGAGADIIFGGGTTGEWNRISNAERQRLIYIETDEAARINDDLTGRNLRPIEAWVGVTALTRKETLANIECAIEARADAAVVAPLSINDLSDVISFFHRDVSDLFDRRGRWLPIFLYDNADIAADPRVPHIRTRDVKRLSRLPFIFGVKVSAPRRVLGNYTKGAGHFKDKGEFGIYVGDAMLMFQVFKMEDGFLGRAREYWNRYLLHNELPIGVVAGPANAMPREWQRAWRACYAADERLTPVYKTIFEDFIAACSFGKGALKMLACLKLALKIDGVISSDLVGKGTPALADEEQSEFAKRYGKLKEKAASMIDPLWISRPSR